jgi:hypothetical protein
MKEEALQELLSDYENYTKIITVRHVDDDHIVCVCNGVSDEFLQAFDKIANTKLYTNNNNPMNNNVWLYNILKNGTDFNFRNNSAEPLSKKCNFILQQLGKSPLDANVFAKKPLNLNTINRSDPINGDITTQSTPKHPEDKMKGGANSALLSNIFKKTSYGLCLIGLLDLVATAIYSHTSQHDSKIVAYGLLVFVSLVILAAPFYIASKVCDRCISDNTLCNLQK